MSERSDSVLLIHRGYLYLGGHIVFIMMEWHDLIPPTSRSDRREVLGIEATGHFSDT